MAPERNENEGENADNGVLATTDGTETTGIGIVEGATAQVEVTLPTAFDEEDDFDDDVVRGEDVTLVQLPAERDEVRGEAPATTAVPVASVSAASAEPAPKASVSAAAAASAAAAKTAPAPKTAAAAKASSSVASTSATAPAASDASRAELDHHERVRPRTSEITLQSRRLGDFEVDRESSDLLTADRLLDPAHVVRPEPEGAWRHLVYTLSGRRINLGASKRARARKQLDDRIAAPLSGGARFVPVLSRKGGVGKTTVTTLLGMALADAREDRIIAVDANPDRGTLAERVGRTSGKTVRDLVRARGDVHGFNDISQIVARDHTRLDVLASDADPHVSEAFSDADYRDVAEVAAHFYSVVLTDTGTGIVHSVMEATLEHADELVIVAGLSIDEARLASETLTWLESNGYAERVRSAVVVLNTSRPGAALVRADELDAHIASGSAISFRDLQPETRDAARELAAIVVEGLRASSVAA